MSDFPNVTFSTSTVNKRYVALRYGQGLEGRCGEIGRRTRLKRLNTPPKTLGNLGFFYFLHRFFCAVAQILQLFSRFLLTVQYTSTMLVCNGSIHPVNTNKTHYENIR